MKTLPLLLALLACHGDTEPPQDTGTWTGEGEACNSCHVGIEPIHATGVPAGECVLCHGGDPTALSKEQAHIQPPSNYWELRGTGLPPAPEGYIKDFAPNQLDRLPPAYVKFINPGDLRVVDETCGAAGCHEAYVQTVKTSIMSTNAGHYMPTRFLSGYQDRLAIYGATAVRDDDCDMASNPGSVCDMIPLAPAKQEVFDAAVASGDLDKIEQIAYDHYLSKSCDTCHASGYGDNNAPWKYRSTGCTSCHMVYDKFGFYLGEDEAMPAATPSFSAKHEITAQIPTEQCTTCHFQGGRIGLLYRGIREAGFSGQKPEHAVAWEPGAYGKANPDFYLSDEDSTNDIDETPPDVHYQRGMHCADCHVGTDVHGDGRLWSTSKQQIDIRCEDCHGTVRAPIQADAGGVFRTFKGGQALTRLSEQPDGRIVLRGVDGQDHPVTQVATRIEELGPDSSMAKAMAPNGAGWSHTDDLTCDSCHNQYNLYCLGCHVSMDQRFEQVDHQTGLPSKGLVKGSRETYSIEHLMLGMAPDGRAQPVIPSQQVQMTVKDSQGDRLIGGDHPDVDGDVGVFRGNAAYPFNNGFHVFFQHTTTQYPSSVNRGCPACHKTSDTPSEEARVRGVYGFGTGEFMLEAPGGGAVDALKFLNDDGTPTTEWVHEGTGPLPQDRRDRAMNVILDEGK